MLFRKVGLVGRKAGMMRIFQADGESVPVTVVEVASNRVAQVKTHGVDGYSAVQVAYGERRRSRVARAQVGHCAKASIDLPYTYVEFRVDSKDLESYSLGSELSAACFESGQLLDVSGVSKGKGFSGAIKRHNFSSQRASHGNSISHNAPGSIGMAQDPGRVFPGKRMAGHLGSVKCTVQNLRLVRVDADRGLLFIKGAVPGAPGGLLVVRGAVKAKQSVTAAI
jgi:large subunit ribosomal protein L3